MKEFPNFVFDGKNFDLCFYDDSVQLYAVVNVLSGVMVSQLIPSANDYVAIMGFSDFLAKRKTEGDTQIYQLIRVGTLDIQKVRISDVERFVLLDSRSDVSGWLKQANDFMISFNDEE